MTSKHKEYVLGTGDDELERLGIQHRLWADATTLAWKKAGIGPGSNVVDLGCGPGHASFDLAQLVTKRGRVLALDESQPFIDAVNRQAQSRGFDHVVAQLADAQNLDQSLARIGIDAVYCRWLLCWLPEPQKALRGIMSLLKPGGKVIIHDYFNWQSMGLAPRSRALEKVIAAAQESFKDRHSNTDISGSLPRLLREAGFKEKYFEVHSRTPRGGGCDSMIAWPVTWWKTYAPKLVSLGKLSQDTCDQALADISRLERDPEMFFVCPPVYEFIYEKP
jgi:ubiquinone/menaquinone biosynthesis C-methylase UbiE